MSPTDPSFDFDDQADDVAPRRRAQRESTSPVLYIGAAMLGLVVLGGIGMGGWLWFRGNQAKQVVALAEAVARAKTAEKSAAQARQAVAKNERDDLDREAAAERERTAAEKAASDRQEKEIQQRAIDEDKQIVFIMKCDQEALALGKERKLEKAFEKLALVGQRYKNARPSDCSREEARLVATIYARLTYFIANSDPRLGLEFITTAGLYAERGGIIGNNEFLQWNQAIAKECRAHFQSR